MLKDPLIDAWLLHALQNINVLLLQEAVGNNKERSWQSQTVSEDRNILSVV